MRLRQLFVVVGCALVSCRESTAPDLAPLVGEWTTTPYVDQGGITSQAFFTIRGDQSYTMDSRIRAAASASGPGDLIGYSIADGNISVRGDSLFLRPSTLRTWDRDFNGGKVTSTRVDSAPSQPGSPDNSGSHFEVTGETLRLHYLSYPADAAVETETLYLRVH